MGIFKRPSALLPSVAVRPLLVVLSAAVTAGLLMFFAFCQSMTALGEQVIMRADLFVLFVALLGMVASALALLYRHLMVRGERRALAELTDRITRLEAAATRMP